jgi:hypothetical protein
MAMRLRREPASRGWQPVGVPSKKVRRGNNFLSNTDGSWYVGLADYGTGGIWSLPSTSTAPTLSTAALCALGLLLAGAGALLVRRQARGSAGA